jgi:hypothetical protein
VKPAPASLPVEEDNLTHNQVDDRQRGGRFPVKFKGRCKDLEQDVYDYLTPSQAAKDYKTTTSKIAEYAGRTYDQGANVQRIIFDGVKEPFDKPDELDSANKKNAVKKAIWDKMITPLVKRMEKRDENIRKAYMLVYGQCSDGVWAKLESMPDFNWMEKSCDLVLLLTNIQTVRFSYQGQQNKTHALIDAQKQLFSMYQDQMTSCQSYFERFKVMVQVVKHCGGHIRSQVQKAIRQQGTEQRTTEAAE